MPQQILIIHGGDAFETREDYLNSLRTAEVTLERLQKKDWKARLQEALGEGYEVFTPRMPNAQNARYAEWKIWFEKILLLMDDKVILVGHSLGAIFLAKYFSEKPLPKKIQATFLVAAPYNTAAQHPLVDFNIEGSVGSLTEKGGQIFLYHSTDDQVVPYSNFERYQQDLPQAHVRIFQDRQHFNGAQFPELVDDIRAITA